MKRRTGKALTGLMFVLLTTSLSERISHLVNNATLAEQATLVLSISSLLSSTGHLRLAKEVISHLVNNAS